MLDAKKLKANDDRGKIIQLLKEKLNDAINSKDIGSINKIIKCKYTLSIFLDPIVNQNGEAIPFAVKHFELLKMKDSNGLTPIFQAILINHTENVKLFLSGLSKEQKTELLSMHHKQLTLLHAAVIYSYDQIINIILKEPNIDKMALLRLKNQVGKTPLHLIFNKELQVVTAILDNIDIDQKIELLRIFDHEGNSALFYGALNNNEKVLDEMLGDLSADQKLEAVSNQIEMNTKNSLLHSVVNANSGRIDKLKVIFKDLDVNQKMELVKKQNNEGSTPLHDAVKHGHSTDVKELIEGLSAVQMKKLLAISDNQGKYVKDYAKVCEIKNMLVIAETSYNSLMKINFLGTIGVVGSLCLLHYTTSRPKDIGSTIKVVGMASLLIFLALGLAQASHLR